MDSKRISALDKSAALPDGSGLFLRVVADRTTVEIYAQKGLVWMPMFRLPKAEQKKGATIAAPTHWRGNVKVFELLTVKSS